MLQIRLSRAGGGSSEGGSVGGGGGGGAGSSGGGIGVGGLGKGAAENVTVACPDHLIIADLPVAKALGAAPSSCSSSVRSVGRRCRRQLGERVHFCVSCDFPIAIYGRLIPCEHAFCLTCARSDSSCYLCDERIQKIQTIKMMEGIYICAAPHCLKSFLKRSDFESHIQELHGDLLRSNEDDGTNEGENIQKAASAETHGKQQTESSTARAPPRPGVSPSANSQDREDRPRRNQSREHTPMRPPQFPLLPFHGRQQQQQQQQSSDSQTDTNPPPSQGAAWFQHPQQPQGFDSQSSSQHRRDSDQAMPERPSSVTQESPFRDYPPAHPFPLPNYPMPVIFNQGVNVPPFGFTPLPADRQQPLFHPPMEMAPRPEITGQQDQSSVLGFPPVPVGMPGFPENYPQWNNVVFANAQLVPQPVNIINPQGFVNPVDLQQVRPPFVQGDHDRGPDGLPQNPPMPKDEVPATPMGISDGKAAVMTPLLSPIPVPHHLSISLPPPPPLPPPSVLQQQIRGNFPGPD